jgi:hypothetical protein
MGVLRYRVDVGISGDTMKGYCPLHDLEYKLNNIDDVCPKCLDNKELDLKWRSDMESEYE